MKTAITVLQEMMMKLSQMPEYECVDQSGPKHQATFEFRCSALGETVTAMARSKREAKQEAARLMLLKLSAAGHRVPPPYSTELAQPSHSNAPLSNEGAAGAVDSRSYVALLKELCEEYKLPAVQYTLVADTGPAHLRHFTMRATIGLHARDGTATTKSLARQRAAADLYAFLRVNLARLTHDFVEEQALVRAHERAMERLADASPAPWKPDLAQRVSDYHRGLVTHTDAEQRRAARAVLAAGGSAEEAAAALGLAARWERLEPLEVLVVTAQPELAFSGDTREEASEGALRYIRRALRDSTPPPPAL